MVILVFQHVDVHWWSISGKNDMTFLEFHIWVGNEIHTACISSAFGLTRIKEFTQNRWGNTRKQGQAMDKWGGVTLLTWVNNLMPFADLCQERVPANPLSYSRTSLKISCKIHTSTLSKLVGWQIYSQRLDVPTLTSSSEAWMWRYLCTGHPNISSRPTSCWHMF